MADDAALNPNKIPAEALKQYAPGQIATPVKVEVEKRKETLLRNRKSIVALHDIKVTRMLAKQRYASETRRQRKDREREERLHPEGQKWMPANFVVSDRIRKEIRAKQLRDNREKTKILDTIDDLPDVLLMVTRISAFYETPKEVDEIFTRLRLFRPWTSVFVRRTKLVLAWLFTIRRYVIVIMPTQEQVQEMIHSRGFLKANKERAPVSNLLIEKHLGDIDVLCIEDMVKVLFEGGEHFHRVNLFLWPFALDQSFADRSKAIPGMRPPTTRGLRDRPEDFPKRMLKEMDKASGNANLWMGPLHKESWTRGQKAFETRQKRQKRRLEKDERVEQQELAREARREQRTEKFLEKAEKLIATKRKKHQLKRLAKREKDGNPRDKRRKDAAKKPPAEPQQAGGSQGKKDPREKPPQPVAATAQAAGKAVPEPSKVPKKSTLLKHARHTHVPVPEGRSTGHSEGKALAGRPKAGRKDAAKKSAAEPRPDSAARGPTPPKKKPAART